MKRALALALLAAACGPRYDGVDVRLVRVLDAPYAEVTVSREQISLPAGVAILLTITPQSAHHGDYDYEEADVLTESAEVAALYPTGNGWEFVLVGADAGDTCVVIRLEGVEEECVPVAVR